MIELKNVREKILSIKVGSGHFTFPIHASLGHGFLRLMGHE